MIVLRATLAVLFAFLAGYQARHSHEIFFGGGPKVSMQLSATWDGKITGAGAETGLREGDQIIEMNGLPFRGWTQIARAMKLASPGDLWLLKVRRDGAVTPVNMVWEPRVRRMPPGGWWTVVFINGIAPWFALLFGFFVAFSRPRDPMAWLFLFLSVSFCYMADARGADWEDGLRQAARFTTMALGQMFGPCFLLLGVYFGYTYPNQMVRRAAWAVAAVLTAYAVFDAFMETWLREDAVAALRWWHWVQRFDGAGTALMFGSVGATFWFLFYKRFHTQDPDVRRRATILLWSLHLSLVPAFFYFFSINYLPVEQISWGVRIFVYFMMGLMPMGLAYVILVHRALDVRVVIRSGLQYAMARGGVWIVQGLAALMGMIWAVRFMEDQHHLGSGVHAAILGGYAALILGIRQVAGPLFRWIDRRFFREAYSTEQVMAELADKARNFVEPDELFATLGERLSQALHVQEIAFFLAQGTRYQPAFALGAPGDAAFAADSAPVRRLRAENEPIQIFLDDTECWCFSPEVAPDDRAQLIRLRTQVLLPLTSARGMMGFASLGPKQSQEPYSRNDLRLLQSLGAQAGLALENGQLAESLAHEAAQKERVHRELEIANEVQQRLFPQKPLSLEGTEVAGVCRPALAVGGDYYDYFPLDGGAVGLAVGDVAGKGVGAAIVMATVQASLRTQVLEAEPDLGGLMQKLNRVVYDASPRNRFVTLFYAQYDRASRVMTYVNAGHNQPYLISRAGGVSRLVTTGVAAGLQKQRRFAQVAVKLEPGDLLFAFTDGISEAMNAAREEYGEDRLSAVLQGLAGRGPQEVIDAVLASVDAFTAGAVQHDDMTMVVLRAAD